MTELERVQIEFPCAVPIPGYAKMFAQPNGTIISTRRGRPRVRTTYPHNGHRRTTIRTKAGVEPARVHQLIAATFSGPRPSPEHRAIHRNGIQTDNRACNVRWALPHEQVAGQIERGTQVRGETHGMRKLTENDVREIRRLAAEGYAEEHLAHLYRCSASNIRSVVKRRTWKHVDIEAAPQVALAGVEDGQGGHQGSD